MSVVNKRSKKLEKIKVNISDKKEAKLPSGMRILLRRACLAVLMHEEFPLPAEVELSCVTKEEINRIIDEIMSTEAENDATTSLGIENNPEEDFAVVIKRSIRELYAISPNMSKEAVNAIINGFINLDENDREAYTQKK